MKSSGLDIQVLDGRQDNEEAAIVSRAGEKGRLTVATNVAGRGTDIGLGEGVEGSGGLHVIIAEPQASVRVDRHWPVAPLVTAIRDHSKCLLPPRTI